MRVAIVHDWLTGTRGGERVLVALLELFPDAEIFTLLHVPGTVPPEVEARPIHTSFIQDLPGAARSYRWYLPLFPAAVERFDLTGFDLVVSSSHCVAKGVRPPPGTPHMCYCHTPMRYVWDAYDDYFGPGRAAPWTRAVAPMVARRLRRWDRETASRVNLFVANSAHVARRIRRFYDRGSRVVHPPVDLDRFRPGGGGREDFHLIVSALVPYKRVDLAIEAYAQAERPLVVVGGGPESTRLRRRAERIPGGRIRIVGPRPDPEVASLMGRCRAFVMPQEEDFGITAVEAQASGAPVVAYGAGGALETVVGVAEGDGPAGEGEAVDPGGRAATGVFFRPQTPGALARAALRLEDLRFDEDAVRRHALRFSREAFLQGMRVQVEALLEGAAGIRGAPSPTRGAPAPDRAAPPPVRDAPAAARGARARPSRAPIHAVQVSGFVDPEGRDPEALLEAWPTLLAAAAAGVEAGVRVTVLQAAARSVDLERRGVRFRFVDGAPSTRAHRLAREAAALRPDVVHLHGMGFPVHAQLLARAAPAPLLVQDHADRVPPRWRRPLHRWGLARVRAVGFTAPEQAEPFLRAGVLASSTRVVPLLESSSRFTPGSRARARARTGLHGDPCVLWVGRLDRNKDPMTALEAVALASRELPDLRLWCCFTRAPLLDTVRARIASDPRLEGRVRLLGRVPHARIQELCRAADLFLSASHFEGSGYALIEALASGLPPVVTDIPSFRRLTDGGGIGALAPPGDASALARALVKCARGDRAEARAEARRHFERSLSFEALGKELRAAYEATAGLPVRGEAP